MRLASLPPQAQEEAGPQEEAEPKEPPRLTAKVLGYRTWTIKPGSMQLVSGNIALGAYWTACVNSAVCLKSRFDVYRRGKSVTTHIPPDTDHDPPDSNCMCGLYGYHQPSVRAGTTMVRGHPTQPLVVSGAILAWGRMEIHTIGFRAEFAEPILLTYNGMSDAYDDVRLAQAVAGELDIPCVPLDELEVEANKFALSVPKELRPGDPTWGEAANPFFGGHITMQVLPTRGSGPPPQIVPVPTMGQLRPGAAMGPTPSGPMPVASGGAIAAQRFFHRAFYQRPEERVRELEMFRERYRRARRRLWLWGGVGLCSVGGVIGTVLLTDLDSWWSWSVYLAYLFLVGMAISGLFDVTRERHPYTEIARAMKRKWGRREP